MMKEYENYIIAMQICRDNGLSPRRLGDYSNRINCTIPEEVLCNLELHKKIIKKLKPFARKMEEWQDVTTDKVFLSMQAKKH